VFPVILKLESAGNRFGVIFVHFDRHGGIFASFNSLNHHFMSRHPFPPKVGALSNLWLPTRSSSFYVKAWNFRLQPRHEVKPPSLLLVSGESYMTPSRTATFFFTAMHRKFRFPKQRLQIATVLEQFICLSACFR
jgi:hypothetical protein